MNRLLPVVILLAAAACGGKVPETRYYQLATRTTPRAAPAGTSAVLAIEPFETDPAYDDERIVYRLTPYRLDYYNYHRWSSAPGTLVSEFLERAFERSGKFSSVTQETGADDAPVTLHGRIVALEEVDHSSTQWLGRIVLELSLTDTATGELLWTKQFEETEPLPARSPEGLARAVSVALDRIARRTLPVMSDLAMQAARERERKTTRVSRRQRSP